MKESVLLMWQIGLQQIDVLFPKNEKVLILGNRDTYGVI